MQDLAGLGAIVGHVKDLVVKVIDVKSTQRQLENDALRIENLMKLLRLVHVLRVEPSGPIGIDDALAVEEPLEIRMDDEAPVRVMMRTPGHDLDLVAGLLFTESMVRDASAIEFATSSRGVDGKAVIDALLARTMPLTTRLRVPYEVIAGLPGRLREERHAFEVTGGMPSAGICAADGTLLRVREDIHSHNAVDKVIGSFLREGTALDDAILVVSEGADFDIVRKAIVARIPMLVAAGAPSTLAVQLAHAFGLDLYAFVRDGRFNVY